MRQEIPNSRCGRSITEKINNLNEPGGPLPLRLQTKFLYAFLIPATRATCSAYLVKLDCIILKLHGISFITTPSITALPHRKPASAGTPRDFWGAQDDIRHAMYKLNITNYEITNYILLFTLVPYFCGAAPHIGPTPPHWLRYNIALTVGLLWTRDQLAAEATTYTTDEHTCPQWNVNPQSQQ
jgi:hypothetical protein